jgi:hypothetical protein
VGHPGPASRDQTLVPADDGAVLAPSEDRLDAAPLAQAAGDGLELGLLDAPRLGGVAMETPDGDLFDGEGEFRHRRPP